MSSKKQKNKTNEPEKKTSKKAYIAVGAVLVLILGFFIFKSTTSGGNTSISAAGENLVIPKSEVSETAKFYPYKAGETTMEVVAVKASDCTIRTAFNTCQVCFDSGRGYYKQQGNVLVCQNCGNKFKMDQVEKIKGGCNPVPIMKENKTDDGTNITISKDFLQQNKDLFGNWKKQ